MPKIVLEIDITINNYREIVQQNKGLFASFLTYIPFLTDKIYKKVDETIIERIKEALGENVCDGIKEKLEENGIDCEVEYKYIDYMI